MSALDGYTRCMRSPKSSSSYDKVVLLTGTDSAGTAMQPCNAVVAEPCMHLYRKGAREEGTYQIHTYWLCRSSMAMIFSGLLSARTK